MQQPAAPAIYQRHCIEEAKKAQEIAPRHSGALTHYATGPPPVPALTIGDFRVPAVFNTADFKQYIADARTATKHKRELIGAN
jgi:hypothetical protein